MLQHNFLRNLLVKVRGQLPLPLQRIANRLCFFCVLGAEERRLWNQRLRDVVACADNAFLPRHPDAGRTRRGLTTMHNGIVVHAGSYYGWGIQRILESNRGCHEPQEERVFAQVLRQLPPGASMIELGAYWAFYSLWFATEIPGARNIMVEPARRNLEMGVANFQLNAKPGRFIEATVGELHLPQGVPPCVAVDGIMQDSGLDHVNLLHSDIQGHELEMLKGAEKAFRERRVDYVFISTHSNELHRSCLEWLVGKGYIVCQEIDVDATFSHDGLIVAQSPLMLPLAAMELSRREAFRVDS